MKRVALLIWIVAMAAEMCAAQGKPPAAPPVEIAIHAGKVLDVRTGKYAADQIIWIEGDRIKAIGSAAEVIRQNSRRREDDRSLPIYGAPGPDRLPHAPDRYAVRQRPQRCADLLSTHGPHGRAQRSRNARSGIHYGAQPRRERILGHRSSRRDQRRRRAWAAHARFRAAAEHHRRPWRHKFSRAAIWLVGRRRGGRRGRRAEEGARRHQVWRGRDQVHGHRRRALRRRQSRARAIFRKRR